MFDFKYLYQHKEATKNILCMKMMYDFLMKYVMNVLIIFFSLYKYHIIIIYRLGGIEYLEKEPLKIIILSIKRRKVHVWHSRYIFS